jgi:hypothetical protein
MGGLKDLSPAKRREVREATAVPPHLCCEDPFWLYKIFQDTQVTVAEGGRAHLHTYTQTHTHTRTHSHVLARAVR